MKWCKEHRKIPSPPNFQIQVIASVWVNVGAAGLDAKGVNQTCEISMCELCVTWDDGTMDCRYPSGRVAATIVKFDGGGQTVITHDNPRGTVKTHYSAAEQEHMHVEAIITVCVNSSLIFRFSRKECHKISDSRFKYKRS